jgi:rod shape determining protein RodA
MLIGVGISSMFMFQVFVNIGVATQILPNTGIPLPFLSSGLSGLLSYMISIGIILNISIQNKPNRNNLQGNIR